MAAIRDTRPKYIRAIEKVLKANQKFDAAHPSFQYVLPVKDEGYEGYSFATDSFEMLVAPTSYFDGVADEFAYSPDKVEHVPNIGPIIPKEEDLKDSISVTAKDLRTWKKVWTAICDEEEDKRAKKFYAYPINEEAKLYVNADRLLSAMDMLELREADVLYSSEKPYSVFLQNSHAACVVIARMIPCKDNYRRAEEIKKKLLEGAA